MSLSEEKTMILKMLEEGKISSEQAAKLLEALEGSRKQASSDREGPSRQKQQNFYDEISKTRDKINDWKNDFKKNYNQKDFDRMVDEFSAKAEKLGKNVAATTFNIVDKVIDFVGSFVETNAFNIFGSYAAVEKSFESEVSEGMDISIEGVNGNILVKKHLENKIVIRSKVRSPQNNANEILKFSNENNVISLRLNNAGNISVAHEIFLPSLRFNKINLATTNGKVYVEDSISGEFICTTKNGPVDLTGVTGDKISVFTKNAKIGMSYVIGRDIDINTNNSVIDIKNIKAENMKAVTMNGRILVENAQNYENAPVVSLYLKTTNGDIKVSMNDLDNRGYKFKGQASNGSINLLIPELIYHNVNKQGSSGSFVEAESNGYGNYSAKVNIQAETNNGYIEIVK